MVGHKEKLPTRISGAAALCRGFRVFQFAGRQLFGRGQLFRGRQFLGRYAPAAFGEE